MKGRTDKVERMNGKSKFPNGYGQKDDIITSHVVTVNAKPTKSLKFAI